jgi:hypothetical protein
MSGNSGALVRWSSHQGGHSSPCIDGRVYPRSRHSRKRLTGFGVGRTSGCEEIDHLHPLWEACAPCPTAQGYRFVHETAKRTFGTGWTPAIAKGGPPEPHRCEPWTEGRGEAISVDRPVTTIRLQHRDCFASAAADGSQRGGQGLLLSAGSLVCLSALRPHNLRDGLASGRRSSD